MFPFPGCFSGRLPPTGDIAVSRHHDFDPIRHHRARFRLLGADGRGARSTIVLGPAILVRPAEGRGPWTLSVRDDGPLEPVAPRCPKRLSRMLCRFARQGVHHRMASAIAVPSDFQRHRIPLAGRLLDARRTARPTVRSGGSRSAVRHTIYGWALAYRFPDSTGPALVDPHDDVPDLPAFYESPVELLDRIGHLEVRGIETRPIALLVREDDFIRNDRGAWINRYFPMLEEPDSESTV